MEEPGGQHPVPEPSRGVGAPSLRRRGRSRSPNRAVFVGIFLLLVAGGFGLYWFQRPPADDTVAPEVPVAVEPEPREPEPDVPPLDLPELSASDAFIRDVVSRLSSHPQLGSWLINDELVRRFVAVVVDLAGNSNPAANVPFLIPDEEFSVREVEGGLTVDPESHRRYDLLAATFASLDTQGSVRLYRQLRPLIDEAFEELGVADRTFDETLALAIQNVLAVRPVEGQLEVVPVEGVYEFQDPTFEARRGAEKAMLRMGPENTRIIQRKLSEIAVALEVQR